MAIVVLCIFIGPDVQWPVVAAFVALQVLSLDGETIVERMRGKRRAVIFSNCFREVPQGEVLRIILPRTPLNRGKTKGRAV